MSVYDFEVPPRDLVPTEAEADAFLREVERRYPDPTALDAEIARWLGDMTVKDKSCPPGAT